MRYQRWAVIDISPAGSGQDKTVTNVWSAEALRLNPCAMSMDFV